MDNGPPLPPDLRGDFPPGTLTRGKEYRYPPPPQPVRMTASEARERQPFRWTEDSVDSVGDAITAALVQEALRKAMEVQRRKGGNA